MPNKKPKPAKSNRSQPKSRRATPTKSPTKTNHFRLPPLPTILLITGSLFLLYCFSHQFLYYRSLTPTLNQPPPTPSTTTTTNLPTHTFIPWKVDVGVSPQTFQNGQWTISPDSASYLSQSAKPGESGNINIYGHNTRTILGNIRAMTGGETITLTLQDGTKRLYQVISVQEVTPDQTDFLKPTAQETLTLYTCSGFWDSNRFIVRAKPISNPQQPNP